MKTQNLSSINVGGGQLSWVLPNPVWQTFVLAKRPVTQIYTICNHGSQPITLQSICLVPGDDSRLNVVGGSAMPGLVLPPNGTCTIDIEATPRILGMVKQALCVYEAHQSSPLWIEIAFAVVRQAGTRDISSILVQETNNMERQRRLREQDGHRQYARVNARYHADLSNSSPGLAAEAGLQNHIKQNPWLNSQRFDGIDPNLNPEPPQNSEARTEFDNQRREQDMEKQLRLGNMPRFNATPKPKP